MTCYLWQFLCEIAKTTNTALKFCMSLKERRRIGFLGGSFDPVHLGHLMIAEYAWLGLKLNKVYFVPAAQNPHKKDVPLADASHRLKMLEVATSGYHQFGIWDGELSMEGPSFTLKTVRLLEQVYPNSHLFWIIGTDQLKNLHRWHGINELVKRIGFILVERPEETYLWPGIPGLHIYPVTNPLSTISSTGIRQRLQSGQSVDGQVPKETLDYIRENNLYAPVK